MDLLTADADDLVIELLDTPPPADPYPLYQRLREIAPNHPSILGMRFLSRWEDCYELLRSPDFSQAMGSHVTSSDPRFDTSAFLQAMSDMLIFTNPPQHTRLRRLVIRAFTPKIAEGMRGYIQQRTDACLDKLAADGGGDLVQLLAQPLPTAVICTMLGVPERDHADVRRWTDELAMAVKPVIDDEGLHRADHAVEAMHRYIRELIEVKRETPADDLLTALIAVEDAGTSLNESELVSLFVTLLGAGSETTTNLISCGTLALLHNEGPRKQFLADPSLDSRVVEELVRFEAPIQNAFPRVADRDTSIGGEEVVEGELVAAITGAANHDPAAFPDPDQLRFDRPTDRPHLSFGQGIHICIGSSLARQEGAIVFRTLFERFPRLRLVDENPPWREAFTLRGLKELRLEV